MKEFFSLVVFTSKMYDKLSYYFQYVKDYISSFIFNWVYLPPVQARKMPIWVHNLHFAQWSKFSGEIIIDNENIYPKMIRLGVMYNAWNPNSGIMIQNYGKIVFKGKCIIGNDTTIYAKDGATITFGDDFSCPSHCRFISEESITIGNNTRFGWNVMLLDTNFHYMSNINDGSCNDKITSPIVIGNHNWLGNGVYVSKGFKTTDYVTIGAGSKCRGKIEDPYTTWCSENKLIMLSKGWYRDLARDADIYQVIK